MAYGATICTVHVEMNRRHLARILEQLRPRLSLCDGDLIHEVARVSDNAAGGAPSLMESALRRDGSADPSPPPCGEGIEIGVKRSDAVVAQAGDTPPLPSLARGEGLRMAPAPVARVPLTPCLPLGRWDAPDAGTWFAAVAGCDPSGAHIPQT